MSESESEESEPAPEGTRLLRQWRGATRPEQVDRLQEVQRRSITRRHGHNVYRNTKVTSLAQEEQSAMPAGVTNVWENSSDDEAWDGADSKELDAEWQALRVAKHWLSDNGPELNNRDAEAEALAMGADGAWVQLRKPTDAKLNQLTWDDVRRMLDEGQGQGTRVPIRTGTYSGRRCSTITRSTTWTRRNEPLRTACWSGATRS